MVAQNAEDVVFLEGDQKIEDLNAAGGVVVVMVLIRPLRENVVG